MCGAFVDRSSTGTEIDSTRTNKEPVVGTGGADVVLWTPVIGTCTVTEEGTSPGKWANTWT
jgi:hypothetical protein